MSCHKKKRCWYKGGGLVLAGVSLLLLYAFKWIILLLAIIFIVVGIITWN